MKKQLFTLATISILTAGLAACGDDVKTTTSTQTEVMQPEDQDPITTENTQTTTDANGNSHTVLKRSQTYVPKAPTRKTTTTETKTVD